MDHCVTSDSREHIKVVIREDSDDLSREVASRIAQRIAEKAQAGLCCVLGLATGSSPTQVYKWLVRWHREGALSFWNVITFNLDEYCGLQPDDLQSYHHFMNVHLFDHLSDIDRNNIHIPDGTFSSTEDIRKLCAEYEAVIQAAGGIDLQLLGMGRMGHIGFNESGSARYTRTRAVYLDRVTRVDAASDFFGEPHVPKKAVTMGVATILEAREILLLAFGENKTSSVAKAVEGPVTPAVPASFLQAHPNATFYLDGAASAGLSRVKTPWLVGDVTWSIRLQKQAVIWLARRLKRSILKLTAEDYAEHSLQDLCETCGPAEALNSRIFENLQSAITESPAGHASGYPTAGQAKSGTAESSGSDIPNSPASKERRDSAPPMAKRILGMSPHPDDDVISMGGTLARLCQQGHEVHVAYQTSGCIAVHNHDALRHLDFVQHLSSATGVSSPVAGEDLKRVQQFVQQRKPGQVDDPFLQRVKTLIRYTEARSAAGVCGVSYDKCIFLDLPFYQTGTVAKKDLSDKDIQIVVDLFRRLRPHQIYAAGDLSDPHGTHRTCLKAIFKALDVVKTEDWFQHTQVYLYRGAWQEWEPYEADMAVPMTSSDLSLKIDAIFRHESQKDRALFPGADPREFWQRARDRNEATAALYNLLGLPENHAMELFVEYKP
ncbi:g9716 [Coccomyxa viridis]|uniref:G9716 protein n=1 Tax=Coccomyxa viridis TaxID=1274662 RepID=A0ABP1G3Q1_9CHLO